MVTRSYMTSLLPSLTYKMHTNFVIQQHLIRNSFAAIELIIFLYKLRITLILILLIYITTNPGSVVGIATAYWLDGPGIESLIFRTCPDGS